jgi:uncharacterized protein
MGERKSHEPGTFSWAELVTDDADAAKAFYSELFGWEYDDNPVPGGQVYSLALRDGRHVAALYASDQPPDWNCYVTVASTDAAAARPDDLGGYVLAEPFDVMDAGRMAVIADPTGAALCLWEPRASIGAQLVNAPGALTWNDLVTPDADAAAAFYGELFGWTTEDFGPFTMFRLPGYVGGEPSQPVSREVIAAMGPAGDAPAHWSANFWVQDADAAAAKAAELGGSVVDPPSDSPGFRNAVLADPSGVTFEISQLRI